MVSKWDTLFLFIMTLPIMGHVVILPIMLDVAGRDAWISILVSIPSAFALAYAIFRLRLRFPDLTIKEMLVRLLGKWFGSMVAIVLIVYFLFLTIVTFVALVDLTNIAFLPETPRVVIIAWFLIFFTYAAAKGIKRIALTAGVLALIGMITGHTVTLMDSAKKDWSQLKPFLEYGLSPVLWGSLILISIWVELLFLLCIPLKNIHEKRLFLFWSIGILLNALMMFSTLTGVITIFGLGQADNFLFPATEIVRIIELGFIDRFDVYALILMTFGSYIRCSLYLRIAYEMSLPSCASKWMERSIFWLYIAFIFFVTVYISAQQFRFEIIMDVYAYMVVLFPIPFILLAISRRKKQNQASVQAGQGG